MTLTTVPLSALRPAKDNPRRSFSKEQIAGLARSIHADGVLQNLIVRPEGDDAYRITTGKRRYLALQLLKKEGAIDDEYAVPVTIRDDLADSDALRIATVENVQREQLHPMDEAEAFAKLLQSGATVEVLTEKTGLSSSTVRRRLALASLSGDAKKALRSGDISLSIAETLTLGTPGQQRTMLGTLAAEDLDVDDVRSLLIEQKASVAMAIFPRDRYTGTLTTDLFADEETTYFDDVDQFLGLQKEAVEALAEEHRKTAAFVEVLCLHSVPWWQYRDAEAGEPAGVVINLHPTGAVEVREGLVRHEVEERVVSTTCASPIAPRVKRERPEFTTDLLYYAACQRSAAVQAALLENPRKGKEAVAVLLFMGLRRESGIRLVLHAYRGAPPAEQQHRSHRAVAAAASALADELGVPGAGGGNGEAVDGVARLIGELDAASAFDAVARLSHESLDRLVTLLPLLCLGQQYLDMVDEGESVFNRIALGCDIRMRSWWTPDAPFLTLLTREQLLAVAGEAGAAEGFTGMNGWTKKRLVEELTAFFQNQGDAPASEDGDRRAHDWLPGILRFPATKTLNTDAAS